MSDVAAAAEHARRLLLAGSPLESSTPYGARRATMLIEAFQAILTAFVEAGDQSSADDTDNIVRALGQLIGWLLATQPEPHREDALAYLADLSRFAARQYAATYGHD